MKGAVVSHQRSPSAYASPESSRWAPESASTLQSAARAKVTHICVTCGTAYPPADKAPLECPICLDERQYVARGGQQWTTLEELARSHTNQFRAEELNLWGIGTEPDFAIAQRALLVQTDRGNILWDCVSLIDDQTIANVNALGGITAIAISHPHYYGSMVAWSRAFGDVPIYLHADERGWVQWPDSRIVFWEGSSKEVTDGMTLVRIGGHFDGYQVLHWVGGADRHGVLLAGDLPAVCADRRWVSFMYSYPNYIPLPAKAVQRIVDALQPYQFERLYGAWFGRIVTEDAKAVVERSAKRYLKAIGAVRDGPGHCGSDASARSKPYDV